MWVSVTSSGEVGSIIKNEHLQIESYTERLVSMFNAIVSRDAQSPHGKFFYVAQRLQERFAHIKEGASRAEMSSSANDESRSSTSKPNSTSRSRQSPQDQTPLHLLSEVAMGSSSTQAQSQSQQQSSQSTMHPQAQPMQNWYPGMPPPPHNPADVMGMPNGIWDPNFDFTQFDLGTGSDADLSALFIPDSMVWAVPPEFNNMQQGYGGF